MLPAILVCLTRPAVRPASRLCRAIAAAQPAQRTYEAARGVLRRLLRILATTSRPRLSVVTQLLHASKQARPRPSSQRICAAAT